MLDILRRILNVTIIASLFFGISLLPILGGNNQYSLAYDELDQQQARSISPYSLAWPNKLAQSFKPKSDRLTRIHLSISKVQNPSDIIVSIRKELEGDDLTSIKVQSRYLFTYPNKALFDCNLPDITVVPEQTYYIVFQHEFEHTQDDMLFWWYNPQMIPTRAERHGSGL